MSVGGVLVPPVARSAAIVHPSITSWVVRHVDKEIMLYFNESQRRRLIESTQRCLVPSRTVTPTGQSRKVFFFLIEGIS